MTSDDALSVLKNLGWFGGWNEGSSETICEVADQSPDTIATQSPEAGEPLDPEQTVNVGICSPLPTPGFRRQPAELEIQIATIVVLAAQAPVTDPTSSGLGAPQWIALLLILCVLLATPPIVRRLMRRRTRPVTEPPPQPWPSAPSSPDDWDATVEDVTLRPITNAPRIAVQPPDGPGSAHRVRLAVHPDPGTRTVQEDHRGRR